MAYMTISTFFNDEIAETRCFLIPASTPSGLDFHAIKRMHCSKSVESQQGARFTILSVRVSCEVRLLSLASVSSWYNVVVAV